MKVRKQFYGSGLEGGLYFKLQVTGKFRNSLEEFKGLAGQSKKNFAYHNIVMQ